MYKVLHVLTRRFYRDPVEYYFRKQSFGTLKNNRSLCDFDYNDNFIQSQWQCTR